jgi:hypothetical protein
MQVRDWSKSGAKAPSSRDEDHSNCKDHPARRAAPAIFKLPLTLAVAVLLLAPWPDLGHARDNGQYASTNPELKAWFDSLRSGKGPCCSDADGSAVSDVDWESSRGHYRVRLDGEWIDVPDEAVITQPNRVGRTMVWPLRGYLGVSIRCFMPGSMT